MIAIRNSVQEDLDFLLSLEEKSFDKKRRVDRKSLERSMKSLRQQVLTAEVDGAMAGAAVIHTYKKSIRIYSIAVLPKYRKKGVGKALVQSIIGYAKERGYSAITLESDAHDEKLINWYMNLGFIKERKIEDYYGQGEDAYKMRMLIKPGSKTAVDVKKRNLVVSDAKPTWLTETDDTKIIQATEYITGEKYQNGGGYRIFNLCSSYEYQSIGYYVSLLASARDQRVIPNVTTMRDFYSEDIAKSMGTEEQSLIQDSLRGISDNTFELEVYFGKAEDGRFLKLGKALHRLFEAPLLKFRFEKTGIWYLKKVEPISPNTLNASQLSGEQAMEYFGQKRFGIPRFREYKYDLAILVDPDEKNPPSCPRALDKFKKAAEKNGFFVDFLGKEDYKRIGEYDALFIRSTTDVRNYTYEFSRLAYAEGLVVIDDPWSILKCSNKLYLSERMKKGSILTPRSILIKKGVEPYTVEELEYPIILKKPDSSFSIGIHKVENDTQLNDVLNDLFKSSELIIAQEYIKTAFDWRIGVLGNEPLYACKYYMAKNHWQIYNWKKQNQSGFSGDFETMPIEDVPPNVLKTALKACSHIGDGLYGVDLKEVSRKVYLIEVNDNPSIDAGVEDRTLGDELYMKIMGSILNRIESSRGSKRPVSG